MLTELSALAWVLLVIAAFVVGVSKTAVPGAGTVAVAIFAAVLPAGVLFLALANDEWVKRVIAVILLAVIAVTLIRRRMAGEKAGAGRHLMAAAIYGSLGGFTTMVASLDLSLGSWPG